MATSKPTKKTASRKPALQVEPAPGKKLLITDVVLRDGHQSLLATRMRTEDMLPIAQKLDAVGYWSLEMWGGATFDTCLRFLKEDPWERLRRLRAALPNTRLQMLLRGQNLVGYRHYSDDVVRAFVRLAAAHRIDVFRVFDAMNDVRNLRVAHAAVKHAGEHLDTAISSFAWGTSHPGTESIVAALQGTEFETGLDLLALQEIGMYFNGVRKKYFQFESEYTGIDTRVMVNQVPGGMMST